MQLLRVIRRNALDITLWVLFAVSVFVMLKASSDPSPIWAKGSLLQAALSQFSTGNQIAFDTAVGLIVGLFVYVLVVRIPERQKRIRLKSNLRRQYTSLKEECITNFLFACNGSASSDLVDQLQDREEFKAYFNQLVSRDQNRWHAVLNGMDDMKVRAIVHELSVFRRELEYTLTSLNVEDPQVFTFLRGLTRVLHRSQGWSAGYDEIKPLSQFMWSMHTGWDFAHGYMDRDHIAEMIEAI